MGDVGYKLDSGATLYRKNGITWKQYGQTDAIHVDSKFIAQKTYTCFITLVAEENYAFDPYAADFAEQVKAVTGGGVKVAIEVTGVGAGFNEALDCMARFGRVALLGCTRNSDFTVDYYKKIHGPGITVIGAHTLARPSVESHAGWFTHIDDITAILRLVSGGRLVLKDLVTETHDPADCGEVYRRLVFDRDFPIAVQFDWRNI
jgi:threonine dehydrogenase-like Zn-dependent dehydrogenase